MNRRNFLALAATAPVVGAVIDERWLIGVDMATGPSVSVFQSIAVSEADDCRMVVGRTARGEMVVLDYKTGQVSHPGERVTVYSADEYQGTFIFS